MNKIYDYFENLDKENRITQAFLIGNVSFYSVKEELYEVFKKFLFKQDINIDECPDVYLLENEDEAVGKDDIKELLKNLSTTSQFNSKKIYIINNCERLNAACNNAILKTLEEPAEGIYAFLITNNMDSVIDTISSRCQKIFVSTASEFDIDEKYIEVANKLIENIESNGIKTIAKNNDLYSIIKDRMEFLNIIKVVFKKYTEALNCLVEERIEDNVILNNNDIVKVSKKLLVINETIKRLNTPLNKNMSIDRFIIEMCRCE